MQKKGNVEAQAPKKFFFLSSRKENFGRYFKAPLLVDALTLNITTFLIAF
jgi:hypothetical protein